MKTVAVIQARMGSSRLPNKVLMPVKETPLLGWMLSRVSQCKEIDEVIVATTTEPRDEEIYNYVVSKGYKVYRGSEDDVLDRYYQAAILSKPDAVIRITADCPLLDPAVLTALIQEFYEKELDFISNSEPLPSTWPDGMDVSIMTFNALRQAWEEAKKPSDREHVTFYFWNNPEKFNCHKVDLDSDMSKYRLTIDYPEDYDVIKGVIEHFTADSNDISFTASMGQIIQYLDNTPELFELNSKYVRGLGWKDSFEKDKKAGFN